MSDLDLILSDICDNLQIIQYLVGKLSSDELSYLNTNCDIQFDSISELLNKITDIRGN